MVVSFLKTLKNLSVCEDGAYSLHSLSPRKNLFALFFR